MQHFKTLSPLLLVSVLAMVAGPTAAPPGQIPVPPAPPPVPVVQQPRDVQSQTPAPTELRGGRSVTTDDQGRFSFVNLPAGRFMLSASKPGYVSISYGQRRPGPGRSGTAIQLSDNQKFEVQLQIPRGGVITGSVLDERGEAIPGTNVRVMRYSTQSGQRTLQQAGNGSTDDRGIYRVYGLQPGEYVVAATPRNTGTADEVRMRAEVEAMRTAAQNMGEARAAEARQLLDRVQAVQAQVTAATADEPTTGYAPVYYPGTTSPASATSVNVGVAEEKSGVDFQLQVVPIANIEGVVVTASGPAAQNVQLTLVNLGFEVQGVGGNSTTRVDRDGRFRISNVAPGQYMLVARGTLGGRDPRAVEMQAVEERRAAVAGRGANPAQANDPARVWAMADVSVDGRDVANLVLTLQPGMTVSGRVAFEGSTAQPPTDLSRLRVSITPADPGGAMRQLASSANGRVDASGKFTISGVSPGKYRLTGSGAGQGWTVGSSVVSGQDTLDVPFEVKPNQSVINAVLTFTDRQTEVTGTLVDAKGQPAPDYTIIVYPADREYWTPQSRRIQSSRPGTDGSFTFRNLPAGEYRVSAVLDPEPGTWYDPQFLQQLETQSMRVTLGPGEKKVQNLRVGGG
jgi:uncharacterized protein (DUF2141 family)